MLGLVAYRCMASEKSVDKKILKRRKLRSTETGCDCYFLSVEGTVLSSVYVSRVNPARKSVSVFRKAGHQQAVCSHQRCKFERNKIAQACKRDGTSTHFPKNCLLSLHAFRQGSPTTCGCRVLLVTFNRLSIMLPSSIMLTPLIR